MFTAEDLSKILADHEDEIKKHVLGEIKEQMRIDLMYSLRAQIDVAVKKFLAEDLAAEIRAQLVESKPAILAAVGEASVTIGQFLTDGLVAEAQKNLGESYKRRNVLKALFE
jgi:hypothetical protein